MFGLVLLWLVLPRAARRFYAQQSDLRTETHVNWDAHGLRVTAPSGDSSTPWDRFHRWLESGRVILLYRSDALFNIVLKRVMTDAQLAELRGRVGRSGLSGANDSA